MLYCALLFTNAGCKTVKEFHGRANKMSVESKIKEWLDNGNKLDCIMVLSASSSLNVSVEQVRSVRVTLLDRCVG